MTIQKIFFITLLSIAPHISAMFYDFSLRSAAARNDTKTVIACINQGIDINAQDEDTGNTALHEAIFRNHVEVTKTLLEHEASQKIKNNAGYWPDSLLVKKQGKTPIEGIFKNKNELTIHADLLYERLKELKNIDNYV